MLYYEINYEPAGKLAQMVKRLLLFEKILLIFVKKRLIIQIENCYITTLRAVCSSRVEKKRGARQRTHAK